MMDRTVVRSKAARLRWTMPVKIDAVAPVLVVSRFSATTPGFVAAPTSLLLQRRPQLEILVLNPKGTCTVESASEGEIAVFSADISQHPSRHPPDAIMTTVEAVGVECCKSATNGSGGEEEGTCRKKVWG